MNDSDTELDDIEKGNNIDVIDGAIADLVMIPNGASEAPAVPISASSDVPAAGTASMVSSAAEHRRADAARVSQTHRERHGVHASLPDRAGHRHARDAARLQGALRPAAPSTAPNQPIFVNVHALPNNRCQEAIINISKVMEKEAKAKTKSVVGIDGCLVILGMFLCLFIGGLIFVTFETNFLQKLDNINNTLININNNLGGIHNSLISNMIPITTSSVMVDTTSAIPTTLTTSAISTISTVSTTMDHSTTFV